MQGSAGKAAFYGGPSGSRFIPRIKNFAVVLDSIVSHAVYTEIGYTLLPFDLIPDVIHVIGHLDDVVIVPLLTIAGLGIMPPDVMKDRKEKALTLLKEDR